MTPGSAGDERATKNERREAAREKARVLREEQKKQERRRKFILQGSIIGASLAIIAIITLVLVNGARPAGPGPLNMISDGIKIGQDFKAVETPALEAGKDPIPNTPDPASSVIDIQLYVDYQCPYCGQFEAENGAQLATWVKSGAATVEIHPLAFLDNQSQGTKYSTRAANAAACVANFDPDRFFEFNTAMFTNQPAEGTPGLTNAEIFERATSVDVKHADEIEKCINDQTFKNWTAEATARTFNNPIPNSNVETFKGTPTVIVNGQKYEASIPFSKEEFAAFVVQVAGSTFTENSTATPSPVPTQAP